MHQSTSCIGASVVRNDSMVPSCVAMIEAQSIYTQGVNVPIDYMYDDWCVGCKK